MFRWISLFQNPNVSLLFPLALTHRSCTWTCGTVAPENNNKRKHMIEVILILFYTTSIQTVPSLDFLLCNGKAFRAVTEDKLSGCVCVGWRERSSILTPIGEDGSLQSASSRQVYTRSFHILQCQLKAIEFHELTINIFKGLSCAIFLTLLATHVKCNLFKT